MYKYKYWRFFINTRMDENTNKSSKRLPKRNLLDIIDIFYEYLGQHDQVFISEFRKIPDPKKRISSPTDKHILEIVKKVQDRPYVYVKKMNKYTLLKLSTHNRDPKVRFIQVNDIISFVNQKYDQLEDQYQDKDPNQYALLIEQYRELLLNSLERLKGLRDREKV